MAGENPDVVLTPLKSEIYRSEIEGSATSLTTTVIEARGRTKTQPYQRPEKANAGLPFLTIVFQRLRAAIL